MSKWFFVQIILLTIIATIVGNSGFRPSFMDNWTPYMNKIEHHRGAGIITLLADELNSIEPEKQAALLAELQTGFGYVISLKPFSSLHLTKPQSKKLAQGEVVFDRSSLQLIKTLENTDQVIVIENMEQSAAHIINPISMSITSTINLIKGLLATLDERKWQGLVNRVATINAVPFAITSSNKLPLNTEQKVELDHLGHLYIETQESAAQLIPGEVIYSRIGNTDQYIVIGPITPAINDLVYKIQLVSYGLLTCILLLPLLIWILPTWLSAGRLRRASQLFAAEDLTASVKYTFASNLNGVAKVFNKMAHKLAHLLNRNKLLAGAISHDLRTPIAAMEFSLALLSHSHDKERRQYYLQQMQTNLAALSKMHKELQLYTEFERDDIALEVHQQRVDTWLKGHLAIYWQATDLSVSICDEAKNAYCQLDSVYLGRALDNLLNNGFNYAKSLVHLSLILKDEFCIICVENDGEPIAKSSRKEIFEPFVRLNHSQTEGNVGSGLGLAIVQQIMHWHKGSVIVEESELGGAKFMLSLPLMPVDKEAF